jgi:hypothetical protein
LETPVSLIAARGSPEAGVCLALGASLSEAAIVRRSSLVASKGAAHELVLASGASAALPGPALAFAATGERFVVSTASDGSGELIGFKAEGEGERLIESWKKHGVAARRSVVASGGRVALSDDEGGASRFYLIDAASGEELWGFPLPAPAVDIAYAPGMLLAVWGNQLSAYDETSGGALWSSSLPAKARCLSAGNGIALVLAQSGSLSAFSLADGKGLGAAPGPYDPSLRPVADGSRAIAALAGGGAEELEVRTGQSLRRWSWAGRASFLCADRERLYAGISDEGGAALCIGSRAGALTLQRVRLAASAFDSPVAVAGSRGGLLILLQDSSLVLVGKQLESGQPVSSFDAAISPGVDTAGAISSALRRFRLAPGGGLRFDLFAQGIPLNLEMPFTAFRYEALSSGKRIFSAKPPRPGEIVAIYDESGRELSASIDELGSVSRAGAYLEKGRRYWIVAGWSGAEEPSPFRLYVK